MNSARLPRVVIVGTYPPTQCGLATYTSNVGNALRRRGVTARVIRLLGAAEPAGDRSPHVVGEWRRSVTPPDAAARLADPFDIVLLQHEYGIYPGSSGRDVVEFVNACSPPIVTVLHTVVPVPDAEQGWIIDHLAARSRFLVVHGDAARDRLLEVHDLAPELVVVIPHGATANPVGAVHPFCRVPTMLTWGLLGPGKGIEDGIEAVALLREAGTDLRYVVAGQTHPNVRAASGEAYRESLQALAVARGVADLVEFDDRYRDWPAQNLLVRSASFVLLPYDTHDQVTSGVLVEALACGQPVIATAFPHAVELAGTGAVLVVPHESPSAIAAAAARLLDDRAMRRAMEAAAVAEGRRYEWSMVGRRYLDVLVDALEHPVRSGAA